MAGWPLGRRETARRMAVEPKLDGWRAIVTVDPSLPVGLEVRSRTGRFITTQVPELSGLTDLGFRMVLDGELVAVSDDGDVDFYMLGQRMLTRRATRTVTLCVFDVLWLDGIDYTQLPYRERRQVLEMLELSGPRVVHGSPLRCRRRGRLARGV